MPLDKSSQNSFNMNENILLNEFERKTPIQNTHTCTHYICVSVKIL